MSTRPEAIWLQSPSPEIQRGDPRPSSIKELFENFLKDHWQRFREEEEFFIFMEFLAVQAIQRSLTNLVSHIRYSVVSRFCTPFAVNANRALFPALIGGILSFWNFMFAGRDSSRWSW